MQRRTKTRPATISKISRLLIVIVAASSLLIVAGCSSSLSEVSQQVPDESPQEKEQVQAESPAEAMQQLEELARSYVTEMYELKGLEKPSEADLKAISGEICSDIRNGGNGIYFHTTYGPSGSNSAGIASALNYAYATVATCNLTSSFAEGNSTRELMLSVLIAHVGVDSSNTVPGTMNCSDGTTSNAVGSQGACSWHGGVDG
ncbi:hypothetical protein [Glutamicibacter arilaitensis]|uniref:hypothetical protein n=1 Tax=Glutamicibacter arilaitensis TaxID=256701 RepID=UPI003FD3D68C